MAALIGVSVLAGCGGGGGETPCQFSIGMYNGTANVLAAYGYKE